MTTLNLQVGASGNDSHMTSITNDSGRSVTVSGAVSLTAATLSPGSHGSGDEWSVAARIDGVTVAQGATINSATFQLRCQNTWNASPNVIKFYVSAQAADNAGALSSTAGDLNATARPRTTATVIVDWSSVTVDTWYSVDITSVVQEIVDRAGWASGNAIVILVDTHADTTLSEWQDFYSYDGAAASAPKLDVDYTSGAETAFQSDAFQNDAFQIISSGSYTETGSGVFGWVVSGSEVGAGVDAGPGVYGMVASGAGIGSATETGDAVYGYVASGAESYGAGGTNYVEAGSGVFGWVASATELAGGVDAGAAVFGYVAAGQEVSSVADAGSGVYGWTVSGSEVQAHVDTGAGIYGWLSSGTDAYSGGGTDYTEAGAGVFGWVATATDTVGLVDGGAAVFGWVSSGTAAASITEAGAGVYGWAVSGTATAGATESGAGVYGYVASGADQQSMIDSGAAVWGMVAAGDALSVTTGQAAEFDRVQWPATNEIRTQSERLGSYGNRVKGGGEIVR